MAESNQGSRDNLAFVIGGIFILGLVFATYSYFNKTPDILEGNGAKTEDVEDEVGELLGGKDNNDQNTEGTLGTGGSYEGYDASWIATDYKQGDIQTGSYTVKSGDTLWEISEAVYGNGADWTKILTANSGNIGYLPDGSQALIMVGQVLTIS